MNNLNEDGELDEELAKERLTEARQIILDQHYTDWLTDNIDDRRKEYIEEYCQSDFDAFCKIVYNQER